MHLMDIMSICRTEISLRFQCSFVFRRESARACQKIRARSMPGAARGQRQHYCDSGSGSFARANAHGAAECRDSFPHSQKPKASAARSSLAGEPNPVILNTQYSRTVIDFKANYEILCPRMLRHIVQRLLHRTVQRNLNFMVQFTKSHRQNQSRSHTCALAELALLFTNVRGSAS